MKKKKKKRKERRSDRQRMEERKAGASRSVGLSIYFVSAFVVSLAEYWRLAANRLPSTTIKWSPLKKAREPAGRSTDGRARSSRCRSPTEDSDCEDDDPKPTPNAALQKTTAIASKRNNNGSNSHRCVCGQNIAANARSDVVDNEALAGRIERRFRVDANQQLSRELTSQQGWVDWQSHVMPQSSRGVCKEHCAG